MCLQYCRHHLVKELDFVFMVILDCTVRTMLAIIGSKFDIPGYLTTPVRGKPLYTLVSYSY